MTIITRVIRQSEMSQKAMAVGVRTGLLTTSRINTMKPTKGMICSHSGTKWVASLDRRVAGSQAAASRSLRCRENRSRHKERWHSGAVASRHLFDSG